MKEHGVSDPHIHHAPFPANATIVCDSPSYNPRCSNLLAGGHVLATEQASEHLGGRATHRLQIRDHRVRQCRPAMPSVSRTCEGLPPALPFAFHCSTVRGAAHAFAALLVCCCACRSSITSSTTHQRSPERSATPSSITHWACISLHCGFRRRSRSRISLHISCTADRRNGQAARVPSRVSGDQDVCAEPSIRPGSLTREGEAGVERNLIRNGKGCIFVAMMSVVRADCGCCQWRSGCWALQRRSRRVQVCLRLRLWLTMFVSAPTGLDYCVSIYALSVSFLIVMFVLGLFTAVRICPETAWTDLITLSALLACHSLHRAIPFRLSRCPSDGKCSARQCKCDELLTVAETFKRVKHTAVHAMALLLQRWFRPVKGEKYHSLL